MGNTTPGPEPGLRSGQGAAAASESAGEAHSQCEVCTPCASPPQAAPPASPEPSVPPIPAVAAKWPAGPREKACKNRPFVERPGWGVADLDPELRPGANGRATAAAEARTKFGATMFSFGVTYDKNHDLAVESERIWARAMPGFIWYSTQPDERLRGRLIVLDHCVPPVYDQMTNRMIDVWAHVWTHWHGYSWYMRLWDDNWVDIERMLPAAMKMHLINDERGFKELAHHGRLGDSPYYPGHLFVGGGASSFLSGASVAAWMGSPQTLSGMADCVRFLGDTLGTGNFAEDVHLTECQLRAGVRLYRVVGLSSQGYGVRNVGAWKTLTAHEVRCRHPFHEVPAEPQGPIITMHYMKKEHLLELEEVLQEPCPPDQ
ncbi:hypothetical protein FNF27_08317 [Cafeteria roenbergensis]|uniref:Hexosyltransferase n=1 Tax=Cafeteria roenbergensis TaxID=33653 RepID=A0A5A8D358_CAFRO|nr:hypothetical protein FNF27_08317 [Cafeteria roenbergensis]